MISAYLDEELKPYLKYSAGLHVAIAVAGLLLMNGHRSSTNETYRIDFIGPTAGISNREVLEAKSGGRAAKAEAAADKPSPMRDPDAIVHKKKGVLPRPSVLSTPGKPLKLDAPEESSPAEKESAKPGAEKGEGAAANADVAADMPNFPYPWYISQVRKSLWERWSRVMPEGRAEAMIEFSILRNGGLTDLRVESSSGEKSFDTIALGAVQAAAPFPPLPGAFHDNFLHVHVRFTSK
ncbi:MAG: TonB family protein [Elusimicrobia bacterium]|nr:TonB family protein [Elusimicrobiota bacterium]